MRKSPKSWGYPNGHGKRRIPEPGARGLAASDSRAVRLLTQSWWGKRVACGWAGFGAYAGSGRPTCGRPKREASMKRILIVLLVTAAAAGVAPAAASASGTVSVPLNTSLTLSSGEKVAVSGTLSAAISQFEVQG